MQITQSIAKVVIKAICVIVIISCYSGKSYGQELEEEFPDATETTVDSLTKIIKINNQYAFQRGDSTFAVDSYDKISKFNRTQFLVIKGNKRGLTNDVGEIIIPIKYEVISYLNQDHSTDILVKKGKKYGLMDENGKVILPIRYKEIHYGNSSSKLYLVTDKKEELHLLLGGKLEPFTGIEKITFFKNSAVFSKDEKFGVIHNGAITIQPEYDQVEVKTDGSTTAPLLNKTYFRNYYPKDLHCVVVMQGEKKGLANVNGEIIYKPQFDAIEFDYNHGFFTLIKGNKWGVYFPKSNTKIEAIYDRIFPHKTKYLKLFKKGKQGVINHAGETILPCIFSSIEQQLNGNLLVVKNRKIGLYNSVGKVIFPVEHDDISANRYLEDSYRVTRNGRSGVISPNAVIVPIQFDKVTEFGSYFIVEKADSVGVYNFKGEQIQEPTNGWVQQSNTPRSDLTYISINNHLDIVDQYGQSVLNDSLITYRYIRNSSNLFSPESENVTAAFVGVQNKNGKWGVFEEIKSKLVIPVVYDKIIQKLDLETATYFIVKKGNKMGVVNSANEILIPFEYQSLSFSEVSAKYISDLWEVNVVAKKNNKYGLIDLENTVMIPFQYNDLVKISFEPIYKAKTNSFYIVVNSNNQRVFEGKFDQVGVFENAQVLTFKNGKMRAINKAGNYQTDAKPMTYHQGYRTFKALKNALVNGLNSKHDSALLDFANKITPSKHLLYLFSKISHRNAYVEYLSPKKISKRYYEVLLKIKSKWSAGSYSKNKLTNVDDYTTFDGRVYSNYRNEEITYGMRELNWILNDAVRLDGFWMSTFFLKHSF